MSNTPSRAVSANGRSYRWMDRPLVVVCVDGCEADYINQAIQAGVAPYLAEDVRQGRVAARRVRRAELHQPEQHLDRHRRAAGRARHLRQLLLRPRGRRGSDDERRQVPALPTRCWRASRTAGAKVVVITAKDKLRTLLGKGMKAVCFSAEKADQLTMENERHHRRARARRQAPAQGLQRRPLGVRVRRRREDHGPRPARRDVPLDHRLRAAQARARARRRPTTSTG